MYDTTGNAKSDEEWEIELVHYTQKHTWDCGLACIMMLLPRSTREYFKNNFDEICKEEGFGRSTWTIDLCYLLKRFSLDLIFNTTFFGVNPDHKSHTFYEKILSKDKERVTQRFVDAQKNGIDIRKGSLKTKDLIKHLNKSGPVILLTNAGFLSCQNCKINNLTSKLITYLPSATCFHGHYIILCGYNIKNDQFYYRNPALSDRVCVMGIPDMNKARTCPGTDEDCILIYY